MLRFFRGLFRGPRLASEERPSRSRLTLDAKTLGATIYAVGDVHGCLDELLDAEERIRQDIRRSAAPAIMVMLGDYIDRGPHSRHVIEHIMRDQTDRDFKRIALCGNHEQLLLDAREGRIPLSSWVDIGGYATIQSYGLPTNSGKADHSERSLLEQLPRSHIEFLQDLPVTLQVGPFLFVHAGIKPGVPLPYQTDTDLLWIREPFLSRGPEFQLTVIHGHTPTKAPSFGPNRIGIDTGCYATGNLSVLKLLDGEISFL